MTTLIFDWSELLGQDASGRVRVRATRWRHEPETLVVPWTRRLRFTGREVLEVDPGLVLSVRWWPEGVASSLSQTLVVPASGEHYAHLLAVDPSTLDPLTGDDLVTAADLMARAEALTARIESGEFTGAAGADGADGVSVESITDDDGDGVATVRLSSGMESPLPLPRGPQGERGERGLTGEQGVKGDRGDTGPAPEVSWSGDRLTVGGQTGPSLTGPQGVKGDRGDQGLKGDQGDRGPQGLKGDTGATGPANSLTIGTVQSGATADATLTGEAPAQTLSLVLPKGATGDRGPQGVQGPPGVVSSASSYVIVGPGRPDQPSTTAGAVTGSEPVGAEYRSTDGASVGAWTWRKRDTGWTVTDGETGWRLFGTITGGTDGVCEVRLQRTRSSVLWHFVFTAGTFPVGKYRLISTFPAGFEPSTWRHDNAEYGAPLFCNIGSGQLVPMGSVGVLTHSLYQVMPMIDITASMGRRTGALVTLPTASAWPTTLPGTPA